MKLTGIWGKWTNLTAWQTLAHYQIALERERSYISTLQNFYHCHLFFKIFTLTVQSDGEGHARDGKGASISDHMSDKLSICQLNWLDRSYNKCWPLVRKRIGLVCVNKATRTEVQVSRIWHGVVCYPMFWDVSHQTAFLRTNLQCWKSRMHRHK
jgi:hypothetical protein